MKENENVNYLMGKEAEDSVTGFAGTITAIVYYIASTTEVLIEAAPENKNESKWVDLERINEYPLVKEL